MSPPGWVFLEISTGHMEFVNAGHNPPVICSRDGEFAYLKMRPGFVLAGMEGMHYRMGTFDFHPETFFISIPTV